MRFKFALFFIVFSCGIYSQNRQIANFNSTANFVDVNIEGVDDIEIKTSNDGNYHVLLSSSNNVPIEIKQITKNKILTISLKKVIVPETIEEPFRKYITKRLERARVIIEIPKNKKVAIYGKNIGVNSNNYEGELSIYIDKGNVRLGELQQSALVKLFLGNVFAALSKDYDLNLKTTNGKISLDTLNYKSEYKKETPSLKKLEVNSIHANIILKQL